MGEFYLYFRDFYNPDFAIPVSEKITMLVACGFVELVQKIWRRYLCPQILEQNENLPANIAAMVEVISLYKFHIYFL